MRRGDVWRYDVRSHNWLTVLISAQGILDDPARRVLYGVRVTTDDPGDVLALSIDVEGRASWVNPGDGLEKLRRGCLTERIDTLTPETLDTLEMRLLAALDL